MSTIDDNTELWDLYTLKNDYSPGQKDTYKSYFRRAGHERLMDPVVSKYLYGKGLQLEYPEGRPFAVCLSHDIDDIYPPFTHRALSSLYYLKKGEISGIKDEIFWSKRGKKSYSYRNFREIMEIEDRYGARSSFYFMATDRNIQKLRLYNIEDLESDLGYITDKGWEVGLHGGYYSYNSPESIKLEKRRLEKVLGKSIYGYRNHWLCFQVPDTWEYLRDAGFKYDTTLGYNDVVGFRNGMCHPFKPYNRKTGKVVDILEIPLTIMDSSLFGSIGSPGKAWETAKQLIDTVEQCHGVITVLWHNNVFSSAYRSDWKILYNKILEYCHSKNAWITSGEEVSRLGDRYVCSYD